MKYYATIFGSSAPQEDTDDYISARKLGELLVCKGFRVKNGGYYGTMEACSRGALDAGRKALGFPFAGFDPKEPNIYAQIKRVETIFERLEALIIGSQLIVVLPGGLGTLTEVVITWMMLQTELLNPRPIVCCIGPKWKNLMDSVTHNMEVTPKDVKLLNFFKNFDQFENKFGYLLEEIKKGNKKVITLQNE